MSPRPVFLILQFLAALTCLAQQPAPLITNVEHRNTISLNGSWRAIVDLYDVGYSNYRTHLPSQNPFFRNAKPQTRRDRIEYDFDRSDLLKVPGDWNTQRESLFFYEGTVWYEKSFSYHPRPKTRVFLYIGAANYIARVGVNGTVICEHEGGFTPFDCEITTLLHEGENFVVVYVNNARKADAVPALTTDWWNYGGLTRDLYLVELPEQFIQDYVLQLKPGTRDQLFGWVKLSNPGAGQQVTVRIPDLSMEKRVTTNAGGMAEISFAHAGLKLWSPDSPQLYKVEIETASDKVTDEIGFRSIQVRGRDILLNGSPVFLRGVSIHEEAPYRSGRAFSDDDARILLGWVKELGGNFVRLAHYPHNEHMVRMAERMGLMVWSEVPVYWSIEWDNPAALANAKSQLTESIVRDRNRASIVIWSVGNETPITDKRTLFMHSLVETVRALDSTRLISAALEARKVESTTRIIDDPLGADLDVLGCNEYIGWYDGAPEDADRAAWQTPYDKPLIMSEFGGDASYGFRADSDVRFSEDYQEDLYIHQVKMLDRIAFLRGASPWILMDFRSPRRLLPGIQDYYNRKGLISDRGEKKKAFYILKAWYQQKYDSERPHH
ncbi:MAG TPA: glycoside hydrolase family 2 TIM barrel-domain containing protein [Terriglobales bacterium]|nr:glycoside hydrolase family 2 TIM barrel-domain containing protein [Terriglobales bacterium]